MASSMKEVPAGKADRYELARLNGFNELIECLSNHADLIRPCAGKEPAPTGGDQSAGSEGS
ncbi:hypothetical protein ACVMH6_001470 [Rhizobium leguminosarum]|nr:hypothetical protein [Rhizobium leguminosarum]